MTIDFLVAVELETPSILSAYLDVAIHKWFQSLWVGTQFTYYFPKARSFRAIVCNFKKAYRVDCSQLPIFS